MILEWEIHTEKGLSLTPLLQKCADLAPAAEGIHTMCAVHVVLCDDPEIQELNRTYRGIDRATDVLSFPLIRYPKGKTAGDCPTRLREAYDDALDAVMLGDLVISMDHVFAQAAEYGHSPEREACYLLVHGLCHLMGYDHMTEDEKAQMRKKEETILEQAGMTRTAGVSDETLIAMAQEAMQMSYSPYSHYPVGAALLCDDGTIYTGCNIENASFGLTNCAERTAVFKAVSEGRRSFSTIAIATKDSPGWPCGACRQVLNEFAPAIRVIVSCEGQVMEANLTELLPHGFGPKDLPENKAKEENA
ncbi:MAG: cytidine deaminase [Clostridia bacterium]|nr:cytidine deaminase [Clostridia bacterium]